MDFISIQQKQSIIDQDYTNPAKDPKQEADELVQKLQELLANPQANRAEITKDEKELRALINNNSEIFSNLEKNDVKSFCDDIEDYFMVPTSNPQILGAAVGSLQSLKMNIEQGSLPNIPSVPKEILEDLYQMAEDMSASPPNLTELKTLLADLEKRDPKNLPPLLQQKIDATISAVSQFLKDPNNAYAKGVAIAIDQSTLYAFWVAGPKN